MSESKQRVTCPGCDKGYRWQASLIGRRVPCKQCGTEFRVPDAPGIGITHQPDSIAEDGTYDLDFDAVADMPASPANHAVPATNGKCPSCNSPVREGAMLCLNCGFNMAEGKKIEAPKVTAMPVAEKKAMRRELAGMKWVRIGLWLNLISILLVMAIVPVPIAAALMGINFYLVIEIIAYSSLTIGTLGSLLCLTAPKESGGRPILLISMALSIGTTIWLLMIDFGPLSDDYDWAIGIVSDLATVLFLYFFVVLARYLEFDQITERAEKVFGQYIVIVLGAYLLFIPFIGCIVLILLLALVIYTLFLYIALLIDLNNALTYHIAEQSE
ncbi:MAG: hypothetical protein AB8C95_10495 [Phycisphaeraceae bacterium]